MAKILKVEISFPCLVELPEGWERALDSLVDMVCRKFQQDNPTLVMWPAGYGSKITSMGIAAGDEHIEFDNRIYSIECAARKDYYGENPHNPDRIKLQEQARAERQARKQQKGTN